MEATCARLTGKRIAQSALLALHEALASIYWYKPDFETFVRATVPCPEILVRLNFNEPKRRVAGELVSYLAADQDRYLAALLDLMGRAAITGLSAFRGKRPPCSTSWGSLVRAQYRPLPLARKVGGRHAGEHLPRRVETVELELDHLRP